MTESADRGRTLDLSLYLVIGTADTGGRPLSEVVDAALSGGVTLVQLREKTMSDAEMTELARDLKTRLAPRGVPLIVNDRLAVALAADAEGLHLGQDDLAPAAARRALGSGRILGVSAGNETEAEIADPALVDYVGVGPAYATGSDDRSLRYAESRSTTARGGLEPRLRSYVPIDLWPHMGLRLHRMLASAPRRRDRQVLGS